MSDEAPKKSWFARHKILTVIGALILIGIIGGAASGGSKSDTSQQSATTTTETEQKAASSWNAQEHYPKIENGMTKTQVEAAIGKTSKNCTESSIQGFGTTEICSYGADSFRDKGIITVTYQDGSVSSKSKTDL
jgi:hypothetical protein